MIGENGISVLIRTFNSAKTLGEVLSGLEGGEGDEVIVVDSGSTDSTLEIAGDCEARIVRAEGPFNYSKSLNLGFAAAKNPWVLVLSSHAIPAVPRFLEKHREAVAQFPDDVVVGYAPGDMRQPPDSSAEGSRIHFYGKGEWREVDGICGNANSIYRRSAWEEVPFDEDIRTAEDKDWFIKMAKRNYRFASIPGAPALNKNQGSLRYMFRKGFSDRKALNTWIDASGNIRALVGDESAALKDPIPPMSPWQFAGAQKKLVKMRLAGTIDTGNWIRYSAHVLGQFFGSYCSDDNRPNR